MYKRASIGAQGRARGHGIDRSNSGGVDETVWRVPADKLEMLAERDRLGLEKTELQDRVRRLGETIRMAQHNFHRDGVRSHHYADWQTERSDLISHGLEIDRKLAALRKRLREIAEAEHVEHKERRERLGGSLEAVFMTLAKEMLAGPVYDRIMFAAYHRVKGEEPEG
jgi:hypothetical protein